MMEVGLSTVTMKQSKPIIKLRLDPKEISRGLRSGLDRSAQDIGLEIQYDHVLGVYQFEQKGTLYTIHFKIKEMLLERLDLTGNTTENILNILFAEVPQITARGNLLHQVSTGLANMLGRFVTMESIYQLVSKTIPGLMIHKNDLRLVLPSRLYADWRGWLLAIVLGLGFKVRMIPHEGMLNLEIYWVNRLFSIKQLPEQEISGLEVARRHPLEQIKKRSDKDSTN